jgi:hypothetical protein
VQIDTEAGQPAAAAVLLATSAAVWACNSQRMCLTFARLVTDGYITVADVLEWLFVAEQLPRFVDEDALAAAAALEVLLSTFDSLASQAEVRSMSNCLFCMPCRATHNGVEMQCDVHVALLQTQS